MTAQNYLNLQQGGLLPPSTLLSTYSCNLIKTAAAHGQSFFLRESILKCSTAGQEPARVDQASLQSVMMPLTVSVLKDTLKFSSFTESCLQGSLGSIRPQHSSQMGISSGLATAFITKS